MLYVFEATEERSSYSKDISEWSQAVSHPKKPIEKWMLVVVAEIAAVKFEHGNLLLKVQSVDQQHLHRLGTCEKFRISGHSPVFQKQNLYFTMFLS